MNQKLNSEEVLKVIIISINVRRGQAKKSGHFQGYSQALILTNPNSFKILLVLRCQEFQTCIENMEVAEINAHLINGAEINTT